MSEYRLYLALLLCKTMSMIFACLCFFTFTNCNVSILSMFHRPGVFRNIQAETLKELVSKQMNGVVVLTDDDYVDKAKQMLGGYELVYGIRSAKGLEVREALIYSNSNIQIISSKQIFLLE